MPWRRSGGWFLKRRRSRTTAAACLGALAAVFILAELGRWDSGPPSSRNGWSGDEYKPDLSHRSPLGPHSSEGGRLVYPYSVIPGGFRHLQELKDVMASDAVVAAHFYDFNLAPSRIIQLQTEKVAHVAYRVGNDVFWTKRKVKLAKGENLITDGVNYARMRCGNRISEDPVGESSSYEPSPEALETPQRLIPPLGRRKWFVPPIFPVFYSGPRHQMNGGAGPPSPVILVLGSLGLAAYLAYRRKFKA